MEAQLFVKDFVCLEDAVIEGSRGCLLGFRQDRWRKSLGDGGERLLAFK